MNTYYFSTIVKKLKKKNLGTIINHWLDDVTNNEIPTKRL